MATQIYRKLGNLPERSGSGWQRCRVICLPNDRQTQQKQQQHEQQTSLATGKSRWQNTIFNYIAASNKLKALSENDLPSRLNQITACGILSGPCLAHCQENMSESPNVFLCQLFYASHDQV